MASVYQIDNPGLFHSQWTALHLPEVRNILQQERDWFNTLNEGQLNEFLLSKKTDDLVGLLNKCHRNSEITNIGGIVYIPENYEIVAATDLHGDIHSLDKIIKSSGFEEKISDNHQVVLVIMGDFVDRGEYSFEVTKKLFQLKRNYKDNVIIMKADHEEHFYRDDDGVLKPGTEPCEFVELLLLACLPYDDAPAGKRAEFEKIEELYLNTFAKLPYLVFHNNTIITHSALPRNIQRIGQLINLEYPLTNIFSKENMELLDIYWTDLDTNIQDTAISTRGYTELIKASPKKFGEWLDSLGAKRLIRGHQYTALKYDAHGNLKPVAYDLIEVDEVQIITFHSNQAYYAARSAYNEGSYLQISPGGTIRVRGVDSGVEIEL